MFSFIGTLSLYIVHLLVHRGYLAFLLSFVSQNQPMYMIFYLYIHTNIYAYFA